MIASWKEFFTAVEQMREYQKIYGKQKDHTSRRLAEKREAEVDACIKAKNAERARKSQPELIKENTK